MRELVSLDSTELIDPDHNCFFLKVLKQIKMIPHQVSLPSHSSIVGVHKNMDEPQPGWSKSKLAGDSSADAARC